MTEMTNNKIQILDDGRRKWEDRSGKHEVVPKASLRGNPELVTWNLEPGTCNVEPATCNVELITI
jgi:hypothetical protein